MKTKADLKEGPDNMIVIFGFFSLNCLVIVWKGEGRGPFDVQGQRGGRILDVDGQEGGGS